MFDIWLGNVELTPFISVFTIALFPIQLLLCFKVKNIVVRLLPVFLLLIITVIFIVMMVQSDGWDLIGYYILTGFTAVMLLICGIGWGIWGLIQCQKKNNLRAEQSNHV